MGGLDRHLQTKRIVDVIWRRFWWILAPVIVGLVGSALVAGSLPKVYRASTTILVAKPSPQGDATPATDVPRADERIRAVSIQIKSRRYLDEIVRTLELAPANASRKDVELASSRLSSNVDVDWDRQDFSWFSITVDDRNARRAADIANRLAALFISQHSRTRGARIAGTADETDESWLRKTEEALRQRDAELARYNEALAALDRRAKKLDAAPAQRQEAAPRSTTAQKRIRQLTDDIQLRSQRLATLLAKESAQPAPSAESTAAMPVPSGDDLNARALARMQRELQGLLTNYGEKHPLVARKREQIAQFISSHGQLSPSSSIAREDHPSRALEIARLQDEIRSLEAERQREQRSTDTAVPAVASTLDRDQEREALAREYESLKRRYDSNVSQNDESKRPLDMMAAAKAEQFQIQDRARPPVKPYRPNVPQMVLFGFLGGSIVGVGLASLLEAVDQTVRTEEEFAHRYPDVPILATIPNLDPGSKARAAGSARYRSEDAAAGGPLAS